MKQLKVVLTILIVLCLTIQVVFSQPFMLFPKEVFYQDETYVIYYQGKKIWLEVGHKTHCDHPKVVYTPTDDISIWRRTAVKGHGIYDEDISFKKLPFPFGLLLASDMVYINKIIYCEEDKSSIAYFNGPPTTFLCALLKKIKNV